MQGSSNHVRSFHALLLGLGAVVAIGTTGCQVDVGGQTLPSPYYLTDDVQYYMPGPQMPLSKEAAALKAYNDQQAQNRQ